MKESVTKENEIKKKSILRPKTSKVGLSQKVNKHLSIQSNQDNFIIKREKENKSQNLLFSKFDFMQDYMKKERKEFMIKMKNLNNINLLEKQIDNLYKWENLFNNFTPIESYISKKKPMNKNETEKDTDENKEFESPILLVDLPESKMNLYFRRKNHNYNSLSHEKKINSSKKNLNIRPMSMYSPRTDNSCFYYSSTFSDYYKEDFKTFIEKIPMLKAKLKINSGKLRKEIYNKNYGLNNKLKILEEKRKDKSIEFNKLHLIIAGERKNPLPLVKSVFFQKYFPQNNSNENQNNNNNELNNNILWNELDNNASNNYGYKFQNRLLLSYYDVNDPSLALFNQKLNQNNKNIKNNYKNINNTTNNIRVYQTKEIHLKKVKEIQKDHEIPQKKIKSKNAKIKIRLDLSEKSIGTNAPNKINTTNLKTRSLTTTNNNIKLTLSKENKDITLPEYKSPNSFPLKISSDVGNISYNKIKKFIKEKQFLNKFNIDYNPIPQTTISLKTERTSTDKSDLELIWDSKKIKPKKNSSLFDSIYDHKFGQKFHYHWDKNGNLLSNKENTKCNVIYFNKCIKTKFNKDLTKLNLNNDNNCFFPINAFNKGDIENYKMKNRKVLGNQKDKENNKDINSNVNLSDKFFVYDFSLDE